MTGRPVARVVGLWRHPVVSMGGQALATAEVDGDGVRGDRMLAVFDAVTGRQVSARAEPALLLAVAMRRDDGEVSIALPADHDGVSRSVSSDDPDVDAVLSAWLGRPVSLAVPAAPPTGFDASPITLLTMDSLRAMSAAYPEGHWAPERFRPGIVVDAGGSAFPEDAWIANAVRFGGVDIEVTGPCRRRAMATLALRDATASPGLIDAIERHHGRTLGVRAVVTGVGLVRVGDEVTLLG